MLVKLHHLGQSAVYNTMFTTPNHGPDGKVEGAFKPTAHIFYSSGVRATRVFAICTQPRSGFVISARRAARLS